MVRVLARLYEVEWLLQRLKSLIRQLRNHLKEPSWRRAKVEEASGTGYGITEAARGTLIHRVVINRGRIEDYQIITPSCWNLGPRCQKHLGVAEKAMLSAKDQWSAHLILRSFDVCSVCTTH